ncbi:4275_t:CDS:10 [Acaulospora morrowiae]|uniref:Nuclear protein localization protein 4 n=1 Tax=Acaulospora morrowiae TaxID=94023 RepID=A0A9N9DNY4_9GLOM|nr:4275_t:CDS:10 [Acaulospora morrowiae]
MIRVRSREGTFRIDVEPDDKLSVLGTKIAKQLNLPDYSSIYISDNPQNVQIRIKDNLEHAISELGVSHGALIYATFEETSDIQDDKMVTDNSSAQINVKQDPVDDFLEKQDGLIKRERDPKFCKHAAKGMCDYCMPLEPYDVNYLAENKIKHTSFHAYLRKINKQNKQNTKFIPPLEEPDFRVKTNCSGGHAPWPEGICTKCQPGAVTLQLQQYRMVDHVEFSVSSLINNFIHFWRSTGTQRFGYLYGRYEPYPDVPLGVKAVVEAIYEPPQEDETDGITLTLPWNEEQMVDEVAASCGLIKVGMIYTDLTDDGTGLGKVICKRHIDSYFLSSQECCFSAAMQNKNQTTSKWSASGKFDSRFVTCVVTGNEDGDIDVAAYQVSNTCMAMVSADIIEPSVDPGVVRVKESTSERYVPEVFYRYKNKYGVNVQESAKPCFPVEYLLVNVTHGFPLNPNPLFVSPTSFPVENRDGVETQSLKNLYKHLGLANSGDVHVNSVSDFHLLTFVKGTNVLDMNDFAALARLATSHEEKDALQLSQSAGWQTLVAIMKSENANLPNGNNGGGSLNNIAHSPTPAWQ